MPARTRTPMQQTTTIAVGSVHVRRVVMFALWRIAAVDVVGERELSDSYYDRAWREISRIYMVASGDTDAEAEFRLVRLAALTAAARTVAATADGNEVELPVSREEISDALRDCIRAIDLDDDLFVRLPADERETVLKCRRAAVRLLRGFGEPSRDGDRAIALGLPVPKLSRARAVATG